MPTAAATTGSTTVSVASGAASPAPRYAAWESSSPPAASTAIAARSGQIEPSAPGAKARPSAVSATDFVNTEAMPKAVPAATASNTLRGTGRSARCIRCAAAVSAATPTPVPISSRPRSPPDSGRSAPP
ncbi:hypothetical protein GTW69_11980, partial [Streptomyces sp. SID7760]|nr:hypothetical protein [Streptomyces sp. SID7760]